MLITIGIWIVGMIICNFLFGPSKWEGDISVIGVGVFLLFAGLISAIPAGIYRAVISSMKEKQIAHEETRCPKCGKYDALTKNEDSEYIDGTKHKGYVDKKEPNYDKEDKLTGYSIRQVRTTLGDVTVTTVIKCKYCDYKDVSKEIENDVELSED
jgi:hypothetical protein